MVAIVDECGKTDCDFCETLADRIHAEPQIVRSVLWRKRRPMTPVKPNVGKRL